VLRLNNVVKQLAAIAELHHDVHVILVLMSALQHSSKQEGSKACMQLCVERSMPYGWQQFAADVQVATAGT
jgi:hypothetical protein